MNANQIFERTGGIVRTTVRMNWRIWRRIAGETFGLIGKARHIGQTPKPEMDDVTLTRKVETVIFRGAKAPKSSVNVNVVDGVVWLRGEVKRPEQVRNLERKARSVPEVKAVENLLHLPKTPAPTRADAPRRQQRTRSSTRRPTPRRQQPHGAVTDDRTDALAPQAEPTPVQHAAEREGRTPAPFGSSGDKAGPSGSEERPVSTGAEERPGQAAAEERPASIAAEERPASIGDEAGVSSTGREEHLSSGRGDAGEDAS